MATNKLPELSLTMEGGSHTSRSVHLHKEGTATILVCFQHPDLSDIVIPASDRKIKNKRAEMGYYKISRHYKWALTQVFDERDFQYVIVVEGRLYIFG